VWLKIDSEKVLETSVEQANRTTSFCKLDTFSL
jgi:hypothetical protein